MVKIATKGGKRKENAGKNDGGGAEQAENKVRYLTAIRFCEMSDFLRRRGGGRRGKEAGLMPARRGRISEACGCPVGMPSAEWQDEKRTKNKVR